MGTRLSLQEQLANSNLGAEATYSQNMIDADKYAMGLDQEKTNQLLQLYQMALESDGTADIEGMASILGLDLNNLTTEQIAALGNASVDPYGDIKYKDLVDWGVVGAGAGLGAGAGTFVAPGLGTAIGGVLGAGTALASEIFGDAKNTKPKFKTAAGTKQYDSWDEAIKDIDAMYAEKIADYSKSGIKAVRDSNTVKFLYNGNKYKTVNEALSAWKKYGTN